MNTHICEDCGEQVKPKRKAKGSMLLELCLWLVCFPIGIIYSLWRVSTKYNACPRCGSAALVPLNTLRGKKLASGN